MSILIASQQIDRPPHIVRSNIEDRPNTDLKRFSVLHSHSNELREFENGVEIGRNGLSIRGYQRWVVGGSTISRDHIAIHLRLDWVVVEDLGSTFGTKVNGRKLPKGGSKIVDFEAEIVLANLEHMKFIVSKIPI